MSLDLQFKAFKTFIAQNSTSIIRERSLDSEVISLNVKESHIKAEVKGTSVYKVDILYNPVKVETAVCTCPYSFSGICKHIVLVLIQVDELLRIQNNDNQLSLFETIDEHTGEIISSDIAAQPVFDLFDYTVSGVDFEKIDYRWIQQHATNPIINSRNYYFEEESVRSNYAEISYYPSESRSPVCVTFNHLNKELSLFCKCNKPKKKMCDHQVRVLYHIINTDHLRIFFDQTFHKKSIQKEAQLYGMENVVDLDRYFEIVKEKYGNIEVKPKVKGLIKLNANSTNNIIKNVLIPPSFDSFKKKELLIHNTRFIVLGIDNYNSELELSVSEAATKIGGGIKNPINNCSVQDLLMQTTDLSEVRFLVAANRLEESYRSTTIEEDLNALQFLVENPMNWVFYMHDKRISDNINVKSIKQIQLKSSEIEFFLKVSKEEEFYEIKPQLRIEGKYIPVSQYKLKLKFFIAENEVYYLIKSPQIIKLFNFFNTQGGKIIIHESGFETFKNEVIDTLEKTIKIEYSFIKKASIVQKKTVLLNNNKEHIVYISESDDFILLTPVLKYNEIEIPILTHKQIECIDDQGEVFIHDRDLKLEEHFISVLLRQHPHFEEQYGQSFYYLPKRAFLDEGWFLDAYETWKSLGYTILGFNSIKNNNLNPNKAKVAVNVSSGIDWFETSVQLEYGGQQVSLKQLQKAVKNKLRYVTLADGSNGLLPNEWIERFEKYFRTGDLNKETIRTSKVNFSFIEEAFDGAFINKEISDELSLLKNRLTSFKEIEKITVPKELNANLRDYQKEGLNWLNFLDDYNFGGCLADDMGLGKTIQMIAFFLIQRKKHKKQTNLVVLPTSLIFNWQHELEKFAPSLKVTTIYGSGRERTTEKLDDFEVVLTSYGTLMSDIQHIKEFKFNYIVLDESQAIKNPDSQRYKAVRLLKARNRIVMTGTPIENNTFDLFAQLSFACPALLGSKQHFRDEYSTPIDKFKDAVRAKELQRKVNPFILRRTKAQVAKELPDKTEMILYCEMGDSQKKVYEAYKKEMRDYLNASKSEKKNTDSMFVLAALTKLRQICDSPALLKEEEFYGDESAKIDVLLAEILEKKDDHKILVFSQFVGMLDLVKSQLDKHEIGYAYLTGKSTKRKTIVEEFQEDDKIRVFLISLKAGGTGLNLTQADYVYIIDPWWNPAVENQAIDRCYRIGQEKHVVAVRLICPGTIEEKIMDLQQSKRTLAEDLIQTDTSILKSLKQEDLLSLLD
jgi:SNF2 family DNA or RNA helicase